MTVPVRRERCPHAPGHRRTVARPVTSRGLLRSRHGNGGPERSSWRGFGGRHHEDREKGGSTESVLGPTGARQRTLRSTNVFAFVGWVVARAAGPLCRVTFPLSTFGAFSDIA